MNGFFNINKPVGMSSAAVVGVLKRLTGEKRVGHAGTLDPEAAGVLPIMVGRATRLFDYLVDKQKEYVAVCAFGTATDTHDATGAITERGDDYPSRERIAEEIRQLTGDIRQKPGMYSAVKVDGKRLYSLARKGIQAEVPERTVHVDEIEILGEEPDHGIRIRVVCGKGTYIRSICDDLGKLCGCPAHMRSLIRTRSGIFRICDAMDPDTVRALAEEKRLAENLIPLDGPLGHLTRLEAPEDLARRVDSGAPLPMNRMSGDAPEEGFPARVYLRDVFRGIAERRESMLFWRVQIPQENEEK